MQRKAIFSIYLLLFTILWGVAHGPLMALTGHDDGMAAATEPQDMHASRHENHGFSEKIGASEASGSSARECCQESPTYGNGVISVERRAEFFDIVSEQPFSLEPFHAVPKSARADLSYKYFSPPEKTILASVVKIE